MPSGSKSSKSSQSTGGASSPEVGQSKYSKSVNYQKDKYLPKGWKYYDNGKNSTYFRNDDGKFFTSRRKVLAFMYEKGGFTKDEIYYLRDGLLYEGWNYHDDLPPGWMYKRYTHKIEGLNTDILYLLSPNGSIYRSRIKIKRCAEELKLSESDLKQLLAFKIEECDEPKKLENPDNEWYFKAECVPFGWKMKKYSYNSKISQKVEEVFHYLTPENIVLRGKKQVYDYMVKTETYSSEDFEKFHFCKREKQLREDRSSKPSKGDWSPWDAAEDLPESWMSRFGQYKDQKKVQFKSPCGKRFSSRLMAIKFLTVETKGDVEVSTRMERKKTYKPVVKFSKSVKVRKEKRLSSSSQSHNMTVWDGWRAGEIPCLVGWQFSIGRKRSKRKIRYKSPNGEVFKSRGPLLRHMRENQLKSKEQLVTLKKLLKINQGKPFGELRKNDKFIKNFEVDWNYLEFLKIRYENESHDHIPEVYDPKLPEGWKKKNINGVDYFKDPTGRFVFNSRKLVVDHLKQHCHELSDDHLLSILEDSDSESDLSGDELVDDTSEDNDNKKKPLIDSENNCLNNNEILGI
eukprot:GFUD01121700.1.p1 GENE.GFUD01121700.1~~GFUD01121700.1.p1  ORF type:complete len:587 (-),score=142.27 GFUD01121700.1:50-1762(-)